MNYVCHETEKLLKALNSMGLSVDQYKSISSNIDGLVLAVNSQNEKHKKFAQEVKRMRGTQREYFAAARAKNWDLAKTHLQQAKVYERDVDKEAEEIITGAIQIVMF